MNFLKVYAISRSSFRFDLIFLVLDPQDEAYDRRLAWHLVSLYHRRPEEEDQDFMVRKRQFILIILSTR